MKNDYAGKRVRQNTTKLEKIGKRERRLQKIGLSLLSFTSKNFPWVQYFKSRNEKRKVVSQ